MAAVCTLRQTRPAKADATRIGAGRTKVSSPVSGFDKRKAQLKTVYKKRELKQERKEKQKTYQKTADKKRNKGSDKRQANLKTYYNDYNERLRKDNKKQMVDLQ